MKILTVIFVFFLLSFKKDSPNETPVRLFEEGFSLEFESTNYVKEKPESHYKMISTYTNLRDTDNGQAINVTSTMYDKKGTNVLTQLSESVVLEEDVLYIGFQNKDMNLSGFNNYPLKYAENFVLHDVSMEYKISSSGGKGILIDNTVTINYTQRKITGQELVKTDAGEFQCYIVSAEGEAKNAGIKMRSKIISWFNPELGIIKTETYRKDKLILSTILKKINSEDGDK